MLVVGGTAAQAAEFVADPHSLGQFTLLNSHDKPVTSGRTDVPLNSEITHARAPEPAPSGYQDASQLTLWTPSAGADPSQWNGGPLGVSTALTGAAITQPMQATNVSNWPLDRDIILADGPSKSPYANLYQLRLIAIESGPSVAPGYYTLEMSVDPGAHTWRIASARAGGSSQTGAFAAGGGAVVVVGLGTLLWRRRRRTRATHAAQIVTVAA